MKTAKFYLSELLSKFLSSPPVERKQTHLMGMYISQTNRRSPYGAAGSQIRERREGKYSLLRGRRSY